MTVPWCCWPPDDDTGSGGITIGAPVIGGDPNRVLYIDGAGNLAFETAFQYDELTNTMRQLAEDDPTATLQEYVPPTRDDRFRLRVYETTSFGEQNAVMQWGWMLPGAVTDGFLGMELETFFKTGFEDPGFQEWHLIHRPPDVDMTGVETRFISYNGVGDDTHDRSLALSVNHLRLANAAGDTRVSIRDTQIEAQEYEDHAADIFRLIDFTEGTHVFLTVEGEAVHGADASAVFWNTSNFYIRDQNGHEGLTVWGPDGTAFDRVMAHRTEGAVAGGAANAGYRMGSGTMFGVFFGSGAPTMVANKGSLYLRTDGTGVADRAYIATDGAGTWTAIVTVA